MHKNYLNTNEILFGITAHSAIHFVRNYLLRTRNERFNAGKCKKNNLIYLVAELQVHRITTGHAT